MAADRDPVFVLVHSPLVGPLTWTRVADLLERRGHQVVVPRLDNPRHTPGPLFRHHAECVRHAVEAHSRTAPVVLVGHSGAGAVLPAAGETLVNEVLAYIFVDSVIPKDRSTRLDDAPAGFARRIHELAVDDRVPPWTDWWGEDLLKALVPDEALRDRFVDELQPLPLRLFEEPLVVPPEFPDAPCGYLLLSAGYEDTAAQAARLGWELAAFDVGHLHMLVEPGAMADALEAMAERLVGAPLPVPDPVSARRERISTWVDTGRRVGFAALAVALALFGVALYWDLPTLLVQAIIGCLVLASLALLPSFIIGYGVAAAEREEREQRGRRPRPSS